MNFKKYSPIIIGLLLAGCATSPKSQISELLVTPPAQFHAGTQNNPTPFPQEWGWVNDIEDPHLSSLIQEALTHNFDLKAAALRLEQAHAQAIIAGADRWPQINGGLDGGRRKQNFVGFPGTSAETISSTTSSLYRLTFNVSWEIDLWGKLRDRKSAAIADTQAAKNEFDAARLSLASKVTIAWFNAIQATLQLRLTQETLQSFLITEGITKSRYLHGIGDALDYQLSRAQTATAYAEEQYRQQLKEQFVQTLEILLGRYPSRELNITEDLPIIVNEVPVGLPSELIERRPDLKVAERRLAASEKRVGEARKSLFPSFRLTAEGGTSSNSLNDLLDSNFSIWSLAGNILQPIFQGRRLWGGLQRSKFQKEEALMNYTVTALNAFKEVESALTGEQYLGFQEEETLLAAEESALAEQLAWNRYHRGLVDIVTLLETQRRTFRSRAAYLDVRTSRLRNRVELYLALGGEFHIKNSADSE